jgi:hypothetical protein
MIAGRKLGKDVGESGCDHIEDYMLLSAGTTKANHEKSIEA